mmetsp:Transcript_11107/g.10637  ORF Transcript_11107/g.10637 Transcript_11107/m.10637 type:complete len:227 (-) Transcript_11107:124-804(-)
MSIAKLYYYKATGRAHAIRLALAAADIEFEDVCAASFPPTSEEVQLWRTIGGNTTTNVPMLQMSDGKVYTQSGAVLRAVGRMGNLMPSNGKETQDDDDLYYLMDKLMADAEDLRVAAYKSFVNWGATKECADEFINDVFPKHAGNMDRQLKGTDFFIGNKMTIADICVYDALVNFGTNRIPGDSLKDFPKLKELIKRVESNPGIKTYLSSEQYAGIYKFDKSTLGL